MALDNRINTNNVRENKMKIKRVMPKTVWWGKGDCQIEVLKTGHYPTTIIGKLPNGKETEIDIDELENHD
jgi:hypothetical protein